MTVSGGFFIIDEEILEQMQSLYEIISQLQDPELIDALEGYIAANLPEFKTIVAAHPLKNPKGGHCSMTEAFWLYHLCKSLQPQLVIESGSLQGYSLYFLRAAAPGRVLSFDPYRKPIIPLDGIEYSACDWTEHDFGDVPDCTLAFFDDHIHQGDRVRQCKQRGVRHAIFHDNYLRPDQSHIPLRYANLLGLIQRQFIFPRIRSDKIFIDRSVNSQGYRWLTYVEIIIEREANAN